MILQVSPYQEDDISQMIDIWNEIVTDGVAFPQMETLSLDSGRSFFAQQSHCGVARDTATGEVVGLYILHPNNLGRCGDLCNASYAVKKGLRGCRVGEVLVKDCLVQAKALGFKILQFNAVVKTNTAALKLYRKLGFTPLGEIPGGFLMRDGHYESIIPHYKTL
ncbi:MAG: GNAT family N-acetyltransferase [Eubacterium sp.]|nr:GNAT family N-acetyltransferase [Eubacterium sp.]